MATLNEIRQRFLTAKNTLPNNVLYYVKQEEKLIIDLNQDQLREGIRSDGSLMPEYSPLTIEKKLNNNLLWTGNKNIGLWNTGSFWSKMYLTANNQGFAVLSSDEKEKKLRFTYGSKILGLTKENILYVRSVISKPIGEAIKNILYGVRL